MMALAAAETAAVCSKRTPGGSSILNVELSLLSGGNTEVGTALKARNDSAYTTRPMPKVFQRWPMVQASSRRYHFMTAPSGCSLWSFFNV